MPTPSQAKQDLQTVFNALTTEELTPQPHFSQDLVSTIQKHIERDRKSQTKLVLEVHSINEPKIKTGWFNKDKEIAKIRATLSFHWLVNGQKSAIPDMIDTSIPLATNLIVDFELTYKDSQLVDAFDTMSAVFDFASV